MPRWADLLTSLSLCNSERQTTNDAQVRHVDLFDG